MMIDKTQFKIGFIFAFLFILAICVNPSFALTINQNTNSGLWQVQYNEPFGQSFTATDTDIGYVGFMIAPINTHYNDLSLTMSLYSGAGDFSSSAMLTTSSFSLVDGYHDWLDLDVSSVSFTQNSVYTIGIFNDTPEWGVYINGNGNPYSGGVAYSIGSACLNADLQFHVGAGNFSPAPEPATIFLIGSGLIGLAGVSRKRKK